MEVNRLLSDELAYELEIRGLPVPSTVLGKRSTLRGALRMEREGMTMPIGICSLLDSASEVDVCKTKLEELKYDIQHFNVANKLNEYKRISSRLCHLRLRLCRIPQTTEDLENEKKQLLIEVMQSMESLGNLMDEQEDRGLRGLSDGSNLDERSPREVSIVEERNPGEVSIMDERVPLLPELTNKGKSVPTLSHGPETSQSFFLRETENLMSEMQEIRGHIRENNNQLFDVLHGNKQQNQKQQNQTQLRVEEVDNATRKDDQTDYYPEPSRVNKPLAFPNITDGLERKFRDLSFPYSQNLNYYLDISRWRLQFDGESSVTNFLERLEEIRISRGVSHEQLLRSACELFTKDALLWYRTHNFITWDDLVSQLKEDFQPYDYEYELWEEIRKRTQGGREKVIVFISSMENLFNRLGTSKPREKDRVKMIQRNLLPYIQSQLTLQTINTIPELIKLARSVEETATRTEKFCPPPTNYKSLLEPDLAYRKSTSYIPSSKVSAIEVSKSLGQDNPGTSLENPSVGKHVSAVCWNCNEKGHRFRKCTRPKKYFCFHCGKPNITARDCECQKNVRRSQK